MDAQGIVLVKTVCCEGFKYFGRRCAICPNRSDNRTLPIEKAENGAHISGKIAECAATRKSWNTLELH